MDSENYSIVQNLVQRLQQKLEQNSRLKSEIFSQSKLLSLRLNPHHSDQAASSPSEFRYPKQFQLFQETLPEEQQDGSDRISQLKTEHEFLIAMISERETYNGILLQTLNEYELAILDILKRLRTFSVEYSTHKLKDMQVKFDALHEMESEFYSRYFKLVNIKQMSVDLYHGIASSNLQSSVEDQEEAQVWCRKYLTERG